VIEAIAGGCGVSHISVLCRSPIERSAAGSTQAIELTAIYQGEHIHAVVVLSLLTESSSGEHTGETRSLCTPVSQWSRANETAPMLIIKRAVFSPGAP
jgi:hypothetical protein